MLCVLHLLAAGSADDGVLSLALIAAMVGVVVAVVMLVRERESRATAQRRAAELERVLTARQAESPQDAANAQRNQVMFDQHKRINQLTIEKLEAEVQVLQVQLSARQTMKDREEAGREAHELMVEKTRLEIDSLRLHIAELRKRMEDWNSD